MPNPWTGTGDPYSRSEVLERRHDTLVPLAREMDLFRIVDVGAPEEAKWMAEAGAEVIIAHVGTTTGGSIGVVNATLSIEEAAANTQSLTQLTQEFKRIPVKRKF